MNDALTCVVGLRPYAFVNTLMTLTAAIMDFNLG